MRMMSGYVVQIKGSGIVHAVDGDLDNLDVRLAWRPVKTLCGRTVTPLNYFSSVDTYRKSYNQNGRGCSQCAWKQLDRFASHLERTE